MHRMITMNARLIPARQMDDYHGNSATICSMNASHAKKHCIASPRPCGIPIEDMNSCLATPPLSLGSSCYMNTSWGEEYQTLLEEYEKAGDSYIVPYVHVIESVQDTAWRANVNFTNSRRKKVVSFRRLGAAASALLSVLHHSSVHRLKQIKWPVIMTHALSSIS